MEGKHIIQSPASHPLPFLVAPSFSRSRGSLLCVANERLLSKSHLSFPLVPPPLWTSPVLWLSVLWLSLPLIACRQQELDGGSFGRQSQSWT